VPHLVSLARIHTVQHRHACGMVFQLAISTSICRSSVTICSGLYFFIGIPALPQGDGTSIF
jgi:hypothetical protein